MKTLLKSLFLVATLCFTGCGTVLVEERPVVVRGDRYDRNYGYRDNRDVRVVETYHGDRGYRDDRVVHANVYETQRPVAVVVRPAPVVRRTVVVKDSRNHDNRHDDKKKKKKNDHDDDNDNDDDHDDHHH